MADHKLKLKKAPLQKPFSDHIDEGFRKERPFTIFIPFDLLPEGKDWKTGEKYDVRYVGEQIESHERKNDAGEIVGGVEIAIEKIGGEAVKGQSKRFSRIKKDS